LFIHSFYALFYIFEIKRVMSSSIKLNMREQTVLASIIENFVHTGMPIGSKYVATNSNIDISPASIRNVMADLEKWGFIEQPHTSAGRMPTGKGYRFYVNSLMKIQNLTKKEKAHIIDSLERVSEDIESILETASSTLANISNQLGVVLAPRFFEGIFDRMELVPIADKKILIVISIKSGLVKTISIEIEKSISRDKLHEVAHIINERLHGLTLTEIKDTVDFRLKDVSRGYPGFIDLIISNAKPLIDCFSPSDLHIGGTSNIVTQPEFHDTEAVRRITGFLDDRTIMLHVLNQEGDKESESDDDFFQTIRIVIGKENKQELIKHCSLITASYHVGSISGTLGVIGPTRMQYPKLVSLVDYMARALTDTFTKKH